MSQIRLLDKHVSELIAAGEVVERPASVIKELMENAVDAGAKKIVVEIQNGGVTYLRVTDDGCGIAYEEVPTAFLRHATSKIRKEEDLDAIATLGFRGEALPSVASVARVELLTRTAGEEFGTRYCIDGGDVTEYEQAGCPFGTTIVVRDLFYNTPARLKFLKRDATEAAQVSAVVDRVALSHPEISVRYLRDSKVIYQTAGDGDLSGAVRTVFGKEIARGMIPVSYEYQGMRLEGLVCAPAESRKNRNLQTFYINRRFVRTKTGLAALEQAYKNRIMVGKFPYCVLFVSMDHASVDVNVHPTKTEVRFSDEQPVFYLIYYGVLSALDGAQRAPAHAAPSAQPQQPTLHSARGREEIQAQYRFLMPQAKPADKPVQSAEKREEPIAPSPVISPIPAELDLSSGTSADNGQDGAGVHPAMSERAAELTPDRADEILPREQPEQPQMPTVTEEVKPPKTVRVVGELFHTYIVCEYGEELVYIDKHAAHERLIFDSLKKQEEQDQQMLLTPLNLSFSKEEYAALTENLSLINSAGFELEDFGIGSLLVRSAPTYLQAGEIRQTLEEIAGYLLEHRRSILTEKLDWIYHSMSCRAAVKGGDVSDPKELQYLAERVLLHDDIAFCPHGRPVCLRISRHQLEKMFGRLQ